MTGGLMQLVAYGAQDVYLTGNPQITFFKVVYRRHTNFAMEAIEQTFNGTADFGKKVTCTVSRNGDLIHRIYLQVTLPRVEATVSSAFFRWVNFIGHFLIKSVEVQIGGQRIDKQYGDWLTIWNELTIPPGLKSGYDNMVGIITGGESNINGNEYKVSVKVSSIGEILMGRSQETVTPDSEKVSDKPAFGEKEITAYEGDVKLN